MHKTTAEALQALVSASGLSKKDFAQKVGIKPQSLQTFLKKGLSYQLLSQYAELFNIKVHIVVSEGYINEALDSNEP
jgi:transcriptional regulator with XRE-family HTH domain